MKRRSGKATSQEQAFVASPGVSPGPAPAAPDLAESVRAEAAAYRNAHDPEGIHRIRVSIRRLRAIFKPFSGTGEEPGLEERLEALADELSPTRDADVFLELVEATAAGSNSKERAALAPLVDAVRSDAETAHNLSLKLFRSVRFRRLIADLKNAPALEAGGQATALDADAWRSDLAAGFKRMRRRWRRARKTGEVADLHRFRIAAKKVRYALELSPGADKGDLAKALKRLRKLQDTVGEITDLHFATEKLSAICDRNAGAWRADELAAARSMQELFSKQAKRKLRNVSRSYERVRNLHEKVLSAASV